MRFIQNLASHVSKQMIKHYSHIRMRAKRKAIKALAKTNEEPNCNSGGLVQESVQVVRSNRCLEDVPVDLIGSSGRIRTYNPSSRHVSSDSPSCAFMRLHPLCHVW